MLNNLTDLYQITHNMGLIDKLVPVTENFIAQLHLVLDLNLKSNFPAQFLVEKRYRLVIGYKTVKGYTIYTHTLRAILKKNDQLTQGN